VPFAAVQADFDALPFAPGQFDLAVFEGSLHYSPDPQATLEEARRMLVPGATIAVMDSPMFEREQDGRAMITDQNRQLEQEHGVTNVVRPGVGFLTFALLDQAARALGFRARFYRSHGPLPWRVRRQLARIRLRRQPAAFGLWVAVLQASRARLDHADVRYEIAATKRRGNEGLTTRTDRLVSECHAGETDR